MTAMVPAANLMSLRRSAHRWQRQASRAFRHQRRAIKLVGSATCAALALAYLAAAWWIIFDIRIGPIVATLTTTHGVHSGDVFGLMSLVLGVMFAVGSAVLLEDGLGRRNVSLAHRRVR